ncbi:MAG TPA: histone deacetylase [Candidatus Bathyarchaeia archaeon]|nr:histone deacetylase [Candidatus Bathyarchaeia archaeon]
MRTGIAFHEKYVQYDLGPNHPFRGDRFTNAMRVFEEQGLLRLPDVTILRPEPLLREDLLRVHDASYVDLIFRLAKENRPYDMETPVSPGILEAALLIAGGAKRIGEGIATSEIGRGVALGCGLHHAGRDYGGGFCLFNDIAILIEFLRAKHGFKRFMVLDYDVHFGNGTSDIYYSDPSVLFISLHQDPHTLYPGTGFVDQIGKGAGTGFNVNIPLPPGTDDATYMHVLNDVFVPLALEFEPEIVIGNGGSDSHFADSLANLSLTVNGFFDISRLIVKVTEKVCDGKVALLVGSGYNPSVLPLCWYALAAGVAGLDSINVKEPYEVPQEPDYCKKIVDDTLAELKNSLKKQWNCFK